MSESGSLGELVVYVAPNGQTSFDVRLQDESIWLTQKQMSTLFGRHVMTINAHIANAFSEGELAPDRTIRKFLIVQKEGKREVCHQKPPAVRWQQACRCLSVPAFSRWKFSVDAPRRHP